MNTRIGSFRPGILPALVKVAMIGTWRGRTFLDDDRDLDDIEDFVPVETAPAVRLPVAEPASAQPPTGDADHSVAA